MGHIDGISRKVLFSGYGIYLNGKIVGIIIDGTFYTKANKELIIKYQAEGCEPFQYEHKNGKIVTMPYVSVPVEVLEDREAISARIYESYLINTK